MSQDKKQWIEKWLGSSSGKASGPSNNKRFWLILIGLFGAALMILTNFLSVDKGVVPVPETAQQGDTGVFLNKEVDPDHMTIADYEEIYEKKIKEVLEQMVGVGQVSVLVNVDSTAEMVVKENTRTRQTETTEKDQQGATRHITDVSRDGEVVIYGSKSGEQPIILKTIKPKIRGIWIVAKGAENLQVKRMILEAISKSMDVPVHRISVDPRKY